MMSWKCTAAVIVVGCVSSAAQAEPRWAPPLGETAAGSIILVGGCHRGERTHFVPEVNRSLPHVHIGEDCEPYRISDSDDDDDDDSGGSSSNDDDDDDDSGGSSSNDDDDDDDSSGPEVCVELGGVEVCS
jgi:hypothetical protein